VQTGREGIVIYLMHVHSGALAAFLAQLFFWMSLYVVHPRPSSLEDLERELRYQQMDDVQLAQQVVPPAPLRVDTFDRYSRRTGYMLINPQTGHVDVFDTYSRRIGTATVSPPPEAQTGQPVNPNTLEVRPLR
jgi:hypothetical protein